MQPISPGVTSGDRIGYMPTVIKDPEFREWWRDLLRRERLSQAKAAWRLSAHSSVHPRTVEKWALGTSLPSYPHLVSIVRAFGELPPALAGEAPCESDGPATGEGH